MYCNKCGKKAEQDAKVCKYCGNILETERIIPEQKVEETKKTKKQNQSSKFSDLKFLLLGSGLGLVVVVMMFTFLTQNTSVGRYYFDGNNTKLAKEEVEEEKKPESDDDKDKDDDDDNKKTKKSKNKTEVETDTTYGFTYEGELTEEDAKDIIIQDSERQKKKNTPEITEVENKFIEEYDITAANLLEMDPEFADELTDVLKKIYKDYPQLKGYLTNITLMNTTAAERGMIAAYQPVFPFALADTITGLPAVSKMSVLLSARYFLNKNKLEKSVKNCEEQGWFPENADIYSPVAHELGHYLSFIALKNKYGIDSVLIFTEDNFDTISEIMDDFTKGDLSKEIIEEAYTNYQKDYDTTDSFDEWRGNISGYALAKDNEGNYIYDETIAEAFHDVYLNGKKAAIESQYIVEVLKERLGE